MESLSPPAKLYVQFCSDTSTGGINVGIHSNNFPEDDWSYTSPKGQAAQVMGESYRLVHLDSVGNPLKLTWYMNCGSIYSCGVNTGPILPYELMMDHHGSAISRWGDEMAYHYHTWVWNGEAWVKAAEFTPCLDDFEETVARLVLDRGFYPSSFRSGWNWMSNLWESYLDEWFPYRFEGSIPGRMWTPYHPSNANWRAIGDQKGWESAHMNLPKVTASDVEAAFTNALTGKCQVMTLWAHLKDGDFPAQIDRVHGMFVEAHAKYPAVNFEYLTARECMRKWRGGGDTATPCADIRASGIGPVRTVTMSFDKPIFQAQPFVACRAVDGRCERLDCTPAGANRWTFEFCPSETLGLAVAATDLFGNAVVRSLSLPLRMWGLVSKLLSPSDVEIKWETNGPSDTCVVWQQYPSGSIQSLHSSVHALKHRAVLTDLLPGAIYRVRAWSADELGQSVPGMEMHVLTPLGNPLVIRNVDPGFSVFGDWSTGNTAAGRYGGDYRYAKTSEAGTFCAEWTAQVSEAALYEVCAWWSSGANRSPAATYVIVHRGNEYRKVVNQRTAGGQWYSLGVFELAAGEFVTVRLLNRAPAGSVVIADAVKLDRPFVPIPAIAATGLLPDDAKVEISGVKVTSVFDGCFRLEDSRGTVSINVLGSGVEAGQTLLIRGSLSTHDGERTLIPAVQSSREPVEVALEAFRRAYPAFDSTRKLDELRAAEYSRLDQHGHVYLDYAGSGLYAESQLRDHMELLSREVFGNPHSQSLTSIVTTRLVEQTRASVLRFFHASPEEYMVVFTQNATGALKLIGESYPFGPEGNFLLTFDNHNSVNGIREFARARGATVTYVPIRSSDLRVDPQQLTQSLGSACSGRNNLFAYPAQSNFTGVQHPLDWIGQAHAKGWDVLLDAACFVPSNRLDLDRYKPDFVTISFYKICGYPTGVGCLLARKSAVLKLRRPWFAGGTITFSSVVANDHYLAPGPAGFEDGTLNYLSLPAVETGLKFIESFGIDLIHTRIMCLTGWLIGRLLALRHSNGEPVIRLYGPSSIDSRGGTVQVNFIDPAGRMFDCNVVAREANQQRISLRAGCHCNPGAREVALGFTKDDLLYCFREKERLTFEEFLHVIDGKTTGAVRASIGLVTTFADVYKYAQFAANYIDRRVVG